MVEKINLECVPDIDIYVKTVVYFFTFGKSRVQKNSSMLVYLIRKTENVSKFLQNFIGENNQFLGVSVRQSFDI